MATDEQVLASLFPSHDLGEASSSSTDPFTFNSNLTAPPFDDDYPKYGEDNDTFDGEWQFYIIMKEFNEFLRGLENHES